MDQCDVCNRNLDCCGNCSRKLGDRVMATDYLVRVRMDLHQAMKVVHTWPEMPEALQNKIIQRAMLRMVDYGVWQAWVPASVLRELAQQYVYVTRSDRYHRMPEGLEMPVEGFITQATMCQDGRTEYDYDKGACFYQSSATPAYRVAYHIKRVPILCYPNMLQPTQGVSNG